MGYTKEVLIRNNPRNTMKNFAVLSLLPLLCYGQFTIDLSTDAVEEIETCEANAKDHPVDSRLAKLACVHAYYASLGPKNLTTSEWDVFQNASKDKFGLVPPPSGFRVRKEVRTLSEQEWNDFVGVIKTMYERGTLRKFGLFHGSSILKYHKGAAFLPWHRVFLTHFEEEMRKINPQVALPYWDYTLDNNITQPSKSVVWSDCFFGNGVGSVTSGPFKLFYGGLGAVISRDIARECASKLINKLDIARLHEYCTFEDITTSSATYLEQTHNLELLHDGVHDWVGGDMGRVVVSAFDPVFYLHHAFIDYIWESFREHQTENCDEIVIENDYRPNENLGQDSIEPQGPDEPMWGYSHITNKHGLSQNWTTVFYRYAPAPSCPNNCEGDYLYCDKTAEPERYPEGLCLTRTIDACKREDPRERRAVNEDVADLIPKLPCGVGIRLKGLPGDGRNRDLSEEESRRILEEEITGEKSGEGEDDSDGNISRYVGAGAIGFAIGIIPMLVFGGIMLYRRLYTTCECKPLKTGHKHTTSECKPLKTGH